MRNKIMGQIKIISELLSIKSKLRDLALNLHLTELTKSVSHLHSPAENFFFFLIFFY